MCWWAPLGRTQSAPLSSKVCRSLQNQWLSCTTPTLQALLRSWSQAVSCVLLGLHGSQGCLPDTCTCKWRSMCQGNHAVTMSVHMQITGPLIRIIGDRFASGVKAAILGTMSALLGKAGPALKPFLPQLQTTFLKCLADPVSQVLRSSNAHVQG